MNHKMRSQKTNCAQRFLRINKNGLPRTVLLNSKRVVTEKQEDRRQDGKMNSAEGEKSRWLNL